MFRDPMVEAWSYLSITLSNIISLKESSCKPGFSNPEYDKELKPA